jgi:hypothetical protein
MWGRGAAAGLGRGPVGAARAAEVWRGRPFLGLWILVRWAKRDGEGVEKPHPRTARHQSALAVRGAGAWIISVQPEPLDGPANEVTPGHLERCSSLDITQYRSSSRVRNVKSRWLR